MLHALSHDNLLVDTASQEILGCISCFVTAKGCNVSFRILQNFFDKEIEGILLWHSICIIDTDVFSSCNFQGIIQDAGFASCPFPVNQGDISSCKLGQGFHFLHFFVSIIITVICKKEEFNPVYWVVQVQNGSGCLSNHDILIMGWYYNRDLGIVGKRICIHLEITMLQPEVNRRKQGNQGPAHRKPNRY